ncbi:MAG: histidine phosphatase family protein [Ruminococcaceae bacterium]|nr:histidine phosphatase family protein [Oscillospiraceae bacterium]
MTTVYFIRHAQSDRFTQDDRTRPLTEEGLADTLKITEALSDKEISHILSSPYKRTIQTVTDLSEKLGLPIETDEDFRERNAGKWHGENFLEFIKAQWEEFNYHILDGECLSDVQKRNVKALHKYLGKYKNETIAIATHGTALSTMINYYYSDFNYDSFMRIIDFMPYVVKMEFDEENKITNFEEILIIEKEYK